jgi:predicted ester cyclase
VELGLASVRQFYEGFWLAFPDSQLVFEDVFAVADKVACRFVVHATHQGPFQGIAPTGKRTTQPGITILRFSEGKCVERWSQADFMGLLSQLGALPNLR